MATDMETAPRADGECMNPASLLRSGRRSEASERQLHRWASCWGALPDLLSLYFCLGYIAAPVMLSTTMCSV